MVSERNSCGYRKASFSQSSARSSGRSCSDADGLAPPPSPDHKSRGVPGAIRRIRIEPNDTRRLERQNRDEGEACHRATKARVTLQRRDRPTPPGRPLERRDRRRSGHIQRIVQPGDAGRSWDRMTPSGEIRRPQIRLNQQSVSKTVKIMSKTLVIPATIFNQIYISIDFFDCVSHRY